MMPGATGSAITNPLFETEIPNIRKWASFKQYYHHWFPEVSHQQPAILQNQREGQAWSSKLHSSSDNSLEKR